MENPEAIDEIYDDGAGVAFSTDNIHIALAPLYIYLLIIFGVLYFYFSKLRKIDQTKDDFYDKFQDLLKMNHWIYMILFPLPFILIRVLLVRNRLKKYRNHPRYSSKTGAMMFKKNELADDEFLKKGQLVEENIRSVDYDVWATEDLKDILVLRYAKPFSKYSKCPKCAYKTYYRAHSRVKKAATKSSTGIREETYECKNCHYHKVKTVIIPKVTSSSSSGSSFGGSSGGGSSFGGGSSGGGGAGVSW